MQSFETVNVFCRNSVLAIEELCNLFRAISRQDTSLDGLVNLDQISWNPQKRGTFQFIPLKPELLCPKQSPTCLLFFQHGSEALHYSSRSNRGLFRRTWPAHPNKCAALGPGHRGMCSGYTGQQAQQRQTQPPRQGLPKAERAG